MFRNDVINGGPVLKPAHTHTQNLFYPQYVFDAENYIFVRKSKARTVAI